MSVLLVADGELAVRNGDDRVDAVFAGALKGAGEPVVVCRGQGEGIADGGILDGGAVQPIGVAKEAEATSGGVGEGVSAGFEGGIAERQFQQGGKVGRVGVSDDIDRTGSAEGIDGDDGVKSRRCSVDRGGNVESG